jgi:N-acetyl-anhydromuramyl-L-alanine amidase AmpD
MSGRLIPQDWLHQCPPGGIQRVIAHWTAGSYAPSDLDKNRYHFLIDSQGKIHRGKFSPVANVVSASRPKLLKGTYAGHTLNCNSGSVGIAACCMAGARERPFDPGRYPLLEIQWARMAEAVAEICRAYGLPVEPRTVLAHGEVQVILGIQQRGKWDPLWIPGSDRPFNGAGDDFRSRVKLALREMEKGAASVSG